MASVSAPSSVVTGTSCHLARQGNSFPFTNGIGVIPMVREPLKELALHGLYSPEQEHDSCGVGMVANIKGGQSHSIITESLQVLVLSLIPI